MFTAFTPRAQQALALARQEAVRFNHNFVDTEHLLLGLLGVGQGVSVTVLGKLGLNIENTRQEVEKLTGTDPNRKVPDNIPYTLRVKEVLTAAAADAKRLQHSFVGTEHLLLGILAVEEGTAVRVLQHFNVDIRQLRLAILKELDPKLE